MDAIINLVSVSSYIAMTTYSLGKREQVPPPPPPPQVLEFVDFIIASLLFIQWVPRLYITLDPLRTFRTMFSIFSLLTTIPVMATFLSLPSNRGTFLDGGPVVFLYPLRFWRLHLSISSCLRPGQTVLFNVSLITQKSLNLGLSIFNTLFTVTAWVHLCLFVSFYNQNSNIALGIKCSR